MVLGDILVRNANKFPEKTAIISQGRSMSYKVLNERVNCLAHALLKRGLKKGDRVSVLVHNCHEFIEIYFAAAKTGGIFCPYNNLLKEKELQSIVNYSTPKILILDADYGTMIDSLKPALESVEHYVCLQKPRWSYMEEYESFLSEGEKSEPGVKIEDDDVMNIIFTAGTTGMPKGAMRTHRHVMTNAITAIIEMKISYEERVLISYPMYHVAFDDHVGRHFFMPNTTVIRREGSFDAEEVLEILFRNRITMCQFVPTMINALLQSRDIDKYDLSCLRLILYTAAPMRVDLLKVALRKFKCGFAQLYGQTESGPFTAMLRPEDHVLEGSERELRKLASVGRPVLDYEIRIVDQEGTDVSVGEVGEIIVRSEAMMKGYWQLPKQTGEKLRDGWFHTGDLGKFDEDGYIYLVDRKDNLIISGGKNIYPREVEDILYQHPEVLEAAVIGVPDDYWGEAVKAIIVLKQGAVPSEEEMIKFCKERLASYKKPKSVEFWGELPKNVQGKILKRVIRERYWKDTGRMI